MGNWSELCIEILELIVDQFSAIEDIVHFRAVCRPWRFVSVEKWQTSIAEPWLMLAEEEDSDNRGFYSLSTKKVYHLNLPEARGRKCWSSYDWLITLGLDLEIHLLNPFSRSRVRLPPQSTLPYQPDQHWSNPEFVRQYFIVKVILSSSPSKRSPCEDNDEKCLVMAIFSYYKKLAFLRLGDEAWTLVDSHRHIVDIIYFNCQFYAVTARGKLLIVDISSPHPRTIDFAKPLEDLNIGADFYLAESVGELFMLGLVVYDGIEGKKPSWFDVYKFNFDNKKWTEVKSLDNRALFVGNNASFAIFPSKHLGWEPNSIYFTDDGFCRGSMRKAVGVGPDMGVYQTRTKKIDDHYVGPGTLSADTLSCFCASLWICPSL